MKIIATAIAALLLFVSCQDKAPKESQDLATLKSGNQTFGTVNEVAVNKDYFYSDSTAQSPTPGVTQKKQPSSVQTIPNPDWDKKIVKTATLNGEVKDYKNYYSFLREKVKSLGGYVAQEQQNQTEYKIENTLSIKIPVDQFDNAVTLLTSGVEKINEKRISSADVTAEFVDTKSRMEAKKQVRQRYIDLLKQAKNMEEILSVQSEIDGIQEEIESATGRIDYLGHAATFSTIDLTYYQVLNASAKTDERPSFGTKLGEAFHTGWSSVVDVFVGLIYIWPLWLVVFVLYLIFKRMKFRNLKQPV